jgi:hypothetical protein
MKAAAFISAIALTASVGLAAPGLAQGRTIGGQIVPPSQEEAVQARCDELRGTAASEPAPTTSETAPTTTEDPTEVPPTDEPAATQGEAPNDVTPPIDLMALTIADCDEGGFTGDPTDAGAMPRTIRGQSVPEEQMGAVQTKCDELQAAMPPAAGDVSPEAATEEAPTTTEAPATTEDPTEVPPTDEPVATQGDVPNDVTPPIDLAGLTLEDCDEGGFTSSDR